MDTLSSQVDAWLQPVAGVESPCGQAVSAEIFREFKSALAGKPDTQFSEAVPPDFRKVVVLAEEMFVRSRDLNVAVGWLRAMLRTRGIETLPQGLRLVQGLLNNFRDTVHPQADSDDGSFYARANAVSVLAESGGLLGDLRQTVLLADRVHGELRLRAVELALKKLSPRKDETPLTPDQLQRFFSAAVAAPALREILLDARSRTKALSTILSAQMDAQETPDLSPLVAMLDNVLSVMPQSAVTEDAGVTPDDPQPLSHAAALPVPPIGGALSGSIQSRADVVRAIDMVCEYLERAEPTNPAQFLLRRAKLLLDQSFLQLINVFAPTALDDIAKLMGVDPASVTSSGDG